MSSGWETGTYYLDVRAKDVCNNERNIDNAEIFISHERLQEPPIKGFELYTIIIFIGIVSIVTIVKIKFKFNRN